MDPATKSAIIRVRLDKAHEDLGTAWELLHLARWRGAINRAYYAIFHVSSAALLTLDVQRSKHSGVQSAFSEFLIKPGAIEAEYGKLYRDARQWREEQDYMDTTRHLDEPTVTQIVQDAERFLARMERYLREVGAI